MSTVVLREAKRHSAKGPVLVDGHVGPHLAPYEDGQRTLCLTSIGSFEHVGILVEPNTPNDHPLEQVPP